MSVEILSGRQWIRACRLCGRETTVALDLPGPLHARTWCMAWAKRCRLRPRVGSLFTLPHPIELMSMRPMPCGPLLLMTMVMLLPACQRQERQPDGAKPAPVPATQPVQATASDREQAEARAIAKEAYIYAFAMLENYNTLYKQVASPTAPEYVGGFGTFRHYSQLYTPDNHDVVTPNNDTPYSWAWLDLRAEPWVVTVPKVPEGRYYVQQWVDLFTYNFAYIGSRATSNDAGSYLITGPGWTGAAPKGIKQVFPSETALVMTLTRIALNGPDDIANVRKVQAGMKLQPLSAYLKTQSPPAAPAIRFPPYDADKVHSHDFIGYLNFLLQFTQPPHPSETELMQRFATIGIGPGLPFDARTLPPPGWPRSMQAWQMPRQKCPRRPRRCFRPTACSARARSLKTTTSRAPSRPRRVSMGIRSMRRGMAATKATATRRH